MKWRNSRESENVKDNRRVTNAVKAGGATAIAGAIIAGIIAYSPFLPSFITENLKDTDKIKSEKFTFEEHSKFIRVMLATTEDVWKSIFSQKGLPWINPKLILFTDSITSKCGDATSDIGPFYCPADSTVYIDLNFYDLLEKNLNSPGDASQAYVVFHEVGHHVQTLLGELPSAFAKMQRSPDEKSANLILVRLELQADCYAGIVFNKSKQMLEPGDLEEAINAASRIGDDWLQLRGTGRVIPDSFTHGTSKQRASWLLKGYKDGTLSGCNTLALKDPSSSEDFK